ncbi:histidine kinase [Streptomyces sp. NBC_00536]|uniref:sensor histidine kinase n=1 Tax=Streptomyces sp. NBC_00536 TaxID=2975769 RepID=UPI002E7FC820|nr:ATP-binding protein [Streptomyces sp. NBC_00536]WUC77089.1 histidine kinase [Streptomyces sp. NBC_00536]
MAVLPDLAARWRPGAHLGVAATLTLYVLGAVSLLLRRRLRWATVGAAAVVLVLAGEVAPMLFAIYAVARFRGERAACAAFSVYGALLIALWACPDLLPAAAMAATQIRWASHHLLLGLLPLALGLAVGRGHHVAVHARERSDRDVREAVRSERSGIAQDAHDFLGHSLTLLALRARLMATRHGDAEAKEGYEVLAGLAREAHEQLGDLVLSRRDGASAPGVAALAALAANCRAAGTPVDLEVCDRAHALGPLKQAALYRVVQEGLTNAARHAPGRAATVRISEAADGRDLVIEISNPLPGIPGMTAAPPGGSGGLGGTGMRARMRSVGGTLDAGPDGTGRYRVRAVLRAATGSGG